MGKRVNPTNPRRLGSRNPRTATDCCLVWERFIVVQNRQGKSRRRRNLKASEGRTARSASSDGLQSVAASKDGNDCMATRWRLLRSYMSSVQITKLIALPFILAA